VAPLSPTVADSPRSGIDPPLLKLCPGPGGGTMEQWCRRALNAEA
jgi:hypothetical protein